MVLFMWYLLLESLLAIDSKSPPVKRGQNPWACSALPELASHVRTVAGQRPSTGLWAAMALSANVVLGGDYNAKVPFSSADPTPKQANAWGMHQEQISIETCGWHAVALPSWAVWQETLKVPDGLHAWVANLYQDLYRMPKAAWACPQGGIWGLQWTGQSRT